MEKIIQKSKGRRGLRPGGFSIDPPGYAKRVRELEKEGLTTSDAQSATDVEYGLVRRMR